MPDHYRLSPSSSSRWLQCPYSAQDNLPDKSGPDADAGTHAHEQSALCLNGKQSAFEAMANTYDLALPLVGKSKAKRVSDGVGVYTDYIKTLSGTLQHELKLPHPFIPEFGGTIDTLEMNGPAVAHLVDFKSGWWAVEPKENSQLLSYSTLAAAIEPDAEYFQITVVQPQAKVPIKHWWTTVDRVRSFEEQVRVVSTQNHKQTGEHCRFCPLRASCIEGQDYAKSKGWKPA